MSPNQQKRRLGCYEMIGRLEAKTDDASTRAIICESLRGLAINLMDQMRYLEGMDSSGSFYENNKIGLEILRATIENINKALLTHEQKTSEEGDVGSNQGIFHDPFAYFPEKVA